MVKAKKPKTTKKPSVKATAKPVATAEVSKPKRQLKKPQTVRQKAERATTPRKPRHIKRATSTVAKPFAMLGRLIARLLRPMRFLLAPFRLRPLRFVGRVLSKILLLGYFRASWGELRQVKWPGARETTKLTLAVFTFAIFITLLISVVDYGLDKVFKSLILN